jgi:hypothetical protein
MDANCTMGATLRTRRFFIQGRTEAWKSVTQLEASSLPIPLEASIRKYTNDCSHFGVTRYSVELILARELGIKQFSRGWLLHQRSDAQKSPESPFLEIVSKFLKTTESCNSTESQSEINLCFKIEFSPIPGSLPPEMQRLP